MILGFGSLAASTPCVPCALRAFRCMWNDFSRRVLCSRYLGVILLIVVLSWLKSATSLAEQFNALAENDEELKAELA